MSNAGSGRPWKTPGSFWSAVPGNRGKTTLAQQIAGDTIPFITLDDATTFEAASSDPVGFVRGIDRAVIDEVQRAPDLILAIKATVDVDPRPGRFLLTGSADLMTLPRVADSLAGRMGIPDKRTATAPTALPT